MRKPLYIQLLAVILLMFCYTIKISSQNCVMNCKDSVVIGLDVNCQATVGSDQLYLNPADCPGAGTVHIYTYNGKDIGNTINASYLDSTLNVTVTGYPGIQYSCNSKIIIKDTIGPKIECKDTLISCFQYDILNPKLLGFPLIYDYCSGIDTAWYFENAYNFICDGKGFSGYFAINWKPDISCAGDGKVEITPDHANLIGAVSTLNPPNGICVTSMNITLPAEGKISFQWALKGAGDKYNEALYCKINNVSFKLSSKDTITGKFTSPELFSGDVFSIELYSDGDSINNVAVITEFEFSTKIKEIIYRSWTARDTRGNISQCSQKISIKSIDLSYIVFPADYDGIINKAIPCGEDYSVKATGQPYYNDPKTILVNSFNLMKFNQCIVVDYTDKKDTTCGGGFILTRTWKITDKCKSILLTHDQVIVVEDKQPPLISALKELLFNTESDKCSGTVIIPALNTYDQCSPGSLLINISTSFGTSGYGPFSDVPLGIHYAYYTVTDQCGNSAQASSKIIIQDKTAPVAIAKTNQSFYLPLSGQLKLKAKDLDLGSYDKCCLPGFKIKRVNEPVTQLKDELTLNCSDVSSNPLPLTFRTIDCNGNITDVTVSVFVKDNIVPIVNCPMDVTINCTQDITNLNLYGKVSYIDNCQDMVNYSFNKDLDNCGKGLIQRYWTIVDKSGNSGSCSQKITVLHNQYWNQSGNEISWPQDYNTAECKNLDDLKPLSLPAGFRQPVLTGNTSCSNILVDFTDKLLSNTSLGCISIERNWIIKEYCHYDASNGNEGIWYHKQILSINEKQKPVLSVPQDITVQTQNGECYAHVNLAKATAIDCDPNPVISNSFNGSGGDISGKYNAGTNLVTITATDHCGNVSTAIVKITVKDLQPPVALCKQGVSIDLAGISSGGTKSLMPGVINNNSTDNCTPLSQLIYSISPDKISCADIGNKTVMLTVNDQFNNTASCSTIISVTDNSSACSPPTYKISGKIKTETGKAVAKVSCNLTGGNTGLKLTGTDGFYSFDQLDKNLNYTIEHKKDLLYLNGVTTFDLLILNDHILGKKALDSPYKFIAADVNNNKKVTLADYGIIKDLILLNIDDFPDTESWRFIPTSYLFPYYKPVLPMFPEKLQFNNLQTDITNADFIGVKMGDLNNSNTPANKINPEQRSTTAMELTIADKVVHMSEEYCIPVVAKGLNAIAGFQCAFDLNRDYSDNMIIELPANGILKRSDIGDHIQSTGNLLLSWISKEQNYSNIDTLFTICGSAGTTFFTSDLIRLNTGLLTPEIYTNDHQVGVLNLNNDSSVLNSSLQLITADPNPFGDYIILGINASRYQKILLNIMNIQGQVVKSEEKIIEAGNQDLLLNTKEIIRDGVYILSIRTENKLITRKMVKLSL